MGAMDLLEARAGFVIFLFSQHLFLFLCLILLEEDEEEEDEEDSPRTVRHENQTDGRA